MKLRTLARHVIFLLLLFCGISINAQDFSTKIEGQIYSKNGDVTAIHVSNTTQNRGTITDVNGYFAITVRLNDTLVFSAVQFKKKEIIVSSEVLKSKKLQIILEDALTRLNEVVVMPYNLTGKLNLDMDRLKIGPIITASTENLPNASLQRISQSERQLYTARTWDFQIGFGFKVDTDPIFNYFSGRTKMLNERIARDTGVKLINEVRKYYSDSLYIKELRIPKKKIDDFVYFCEADSTFVNLILTQDKLNLWEFMKKRSEIYRKNNKLD